MTFGTKTKNIGGEYYCVYCGQVAEIVPGGDTMEDLEYYCNCEHGKEEQLAKEILCRLNLIERQNKILDNIKYEDELRQLKFKYNK